MGGEFSTWLYVGVLVVQLVLIGLLIFNARQMRKIRRDQAEIDTRQAEILREIEQTKELAHSVGAPPGMQISGGVRISQGPDGKQRVEVMGDDDMPPEIRAGLREALTHWLESMKRRDN